MSQLREQALKAKEASYQLSVTGVSQKNDALIKIAEKLIQKKDYILEENKKDLLHAEENGVKPTMLDRLRLTEQRIYDMAEGVRQVVALKDPVGEVINMTERPNGLVIGKKRVPLGLVGIIYEARPNVTVDAVCLTLKTGNATLLRGGKEALCSNLALTAVMREAITEAGLPESTVEILSDTSRETAKEMMQLSGILDVLIPRGGAGLIKTVVENATVPVIETGTGNCHTYVDDSADLEMALSILINAKTQRPSVCNACESLLVSEKIAEEFLPMAKTALEEKGVELRGCEKTRKIIPINAATNEDFYTEYNDLILSVKIVSGIDEAISHINLHNTKHSECIVTKDYANSQKFLKSVDAAAVYINASTRFTDGFEFGYGAEIGISTQKLHARGPMGLEALTTIKYIIYGNGQIRG
ncbi:MAG: glutamate-5-semialdehyde dehydrogenase [Clostridia bacterium]|nr:glutamate-5-semialdehyde dehydrogenase [Clostridia bacterium]